MTDTYQPPFSVNAEIVALVAEISETLGRLVLRYDSSLLLRHRRADRIRSVQGSLAIEGDAVAESAYVSEKMTEKTSEKILALIKENTATTIAELARITGLSARTIERNIKTLRNQGRLLRIGPDKGGHWKVLERGP